MKKLSHFSVLSILLLLVIAGTVKSQTTIFSDNCNAQGSWTINGGGGNFSNVDPTSPTDDHTGTGNCFLTNGNSNYASATTYILESPSIDLGSYINVTVEFWMWINVEGSVSNYDGGFIELYDGSTWTQATNSELDINYNKTISSSFSNPYGGKSAYTHDYSSWTKITITLPSSYNGITTFKVRFKFAGDNSSHYEGWAIDDVTVKGTKTVTFDGSTDNDWNIAANWSNDTVPTASHDIVIPSAKTVVVGEFNATCNNLTIASGGTLTYSNTNSSYKLEVKGNLDCSGTLSHTGTHYVRLSGTSKTLSGSGTMTTGELEFTGSYTLGTAISVEEIYINGGTLDVNNSNNFGITLTGNWTNSLGTFNEQNGTVTLSGSTNANISAETFYILVVNKSSATATTTGDITITNELQSDGGTFKITGETITCNNLVDINGGTIQLTSGVLYFNNDDDADWDQDGGTLDIDGGELRIGNYSNDHSDADLNIDGGTIDLSGGTINITDCFDIDGGTVTISGGTVNVKAATGSGSGDADQKFDVASMATFNMTGGKLYLKGAYSNSTLYDALIFNTGSIINITGGTIVCTGTGSYDEDYYIETNTKAIYNLEIDKSGNTVFFASSDVPDINGNITLTAGTLDPKSNDLYMEGSWINNGGTFIEDYSYMRLNGNGNVTINGENLTKLIVNKCATCTTTITDKVTITQELQIDGGVFKITDTVIVQSSGSNVDINGGKLLLSSGFLYYDNNCSCFWDQDGGTLDIDGGELRIGNLGTDEFTDLLLTSGTIDISGGTVNITDQFDVKGGTVNISGGTINVKAHTSTLTGSVDYKMDVSGGTFNQTGGTINLKGAYSSSASYPAIQFDTDVTVNATGGTIVATGTGSNDESYYLNPNGKGINNLTIDHSGFTIYAKSDLDLKGNFTITNGTVDVTYMTDKNINLEGNWTNDGTFTQGTALVTFDGSSAQSINGSTSTTFYNLTLNNTGNEITANKATTVSQTLTLTAGNLITTSSNLLTVEDNVDPGFSGGSASSFINGPVKKKYTSISAISIPVGDNSKYMPVTVTPSAATEEHWTAQYISTTYSSTAVCGGDNLDHVSSAEYWNIDRGSGNNVSAKIRLPWDASSAVTENQSSSLRIAHWNSGSSCWEEATSSVTIDTTNNYLETNVNLTSFSPFTLGSTDGNNPLPISLLDFRTSCNDDHVELTWTTATEINNDYFTIEKSLDGVNFSSIANIDGAGNSTGVLNYIYADEAISSTGSYYRLKQTDFDGSSETFFTDFANCAIRNHDLKIKSIRANKSIEINVDITNGETYKIQIFNTSGQVVYTQNGVSNDNTLQTIYLNTLSRGIYTVMLSSKNTNKFKRIFW